jgi:hypothetical protein
VHRRKLGRTTTTKKSFFLPDHDEMVVARTFDAENSSWLMWTSKLMMILNQNYCICASSAS